ncbi:MAG: tetratricopeptide repeat protein [Pontiellaceae bacterium]
MVNRSSKIVLISGLMMVQLTVFSSAYGEDVKSAGISELFSSANTALQQGNYQAAIPILEEVVERTSGIDQEQGRQTCQTCRFQLTRAFFQIGAPADALPVIEAYLANEPRDQETLILRMQAQAYFDVQEWEKVQASALQLLDIPKLSEEDEYNGNLLLGQALFRQEKWLESIESLAYAGQESPDERTRNLCNIMQVRALVEAESWSKLFGLIPQLYRTDAKYDITLNLTLMRAGKARYENEDYLNSLLLYRMVLSRDVLLNYTDSKIDRLQKKLNSDKRIGIIESEIQKRQAEINDLASSKEVLIELPAYEDEVTFRIGQIYAEIKRFWEGFVLFDKLYKQDRTSEIGEAAMLQSVLVLYDVKEIQRAEERILTYLGEQPDGQYARTLLSLMMRDNLVKQEFADVVRLKDSMDLIPYSSDIDERALQADLHYMMAFGQFQSRNYAEAEAEFGMILAEYENSVHFNDARYYRGMTRMLQARYAEALEDFVTYRNQNGLGEHAAAALFRSGVCRFGLEEIEKAEALFSEFISTYNEDVLISEAYSMRGDIEASKESTPEDPNPLDRALSDYRNGIDTATAPLQASYAAFQAAKVYKLEERWEEIIELMNYYLDRWEELANVAESTFWIGQAQTELGQLDEAVNAYVDTIERFGNDLFQEGVDKIILELKRVASESMSEKDQTLLASRIGFLGEDVMEGQLVLQMRLRALEAMLTGTEDIFGQSLIADEVALASLSPVSLGILADVLVNSAPERVEEVTAYFIESYEDSELLWKAHRAQAELFYQEQQLDQLFYVIEEAQSLFGADAYMDWAQIMKAEAQFAMMDYEGAEESYNMVLGVAEWRGATYARAMIGMGNCRLEKNDLDAAHSFFQRVYLLFKGYDDGLWAAQGYIAAAETLEALGRLEEAENTLLSMIEDSYTQDHPLVEEAKQVLKRL